MADSPDKVGEQLTDEIAPCPFCGHAQDGGSLHYNGSGPPPSYAVECGYCGARGSHESGSFRDDHAGARSAAVRAWNEALASASRRGAEAERERLVPLLKEVDGILVGHHDSRLVRFRGDCPVCPADIFRRIGDVVRARTQKGESE
jgi:hypothetical protein